MTILDRLTNVETIDSRELVDLIDELESNAEAFAGDPEGEDDAEREDDAADLAALITLRKECEHYSGDTFRDGVQFIADYYFEDYARELAEDLGAVNPSADWPTSYIDWPAAARALRLDYTSAKIDGRTYWYR